MGEEAVTINFYFASRQPFSMYSLFQLSIKYLGYYLRASNGKGHGIHSPFVFDFIKKILNDRTVYPEYEKVEALRKQLHIDHTVLQVEDFGAGSSVSNTNQRTVSSIVKNAVKPVKFGQLLYRMVKFYQPATILELGTSLGITSSYLSLANTTARLVTIEGSKEIAAVAAKNFDHLNPGNITLIQGNFDDQLTVALQQISLLHFAFIDGNHRRQATLNYFHQLIPVITNESILVFDDIHWSREMEEAWEEIKNDSSVTVTIDLFFLGIVFFRKEFKEKQHFVIRF
jgi:predicted O-methyltransferase YrrM